MSHLVEDARAGRRPAGRRCAARTTSTGRCRGWRWTAAARATWRRIRDTLGVAAELARRLAGDLPAALAEAAAALTGHDALLARLEAALVAEPPLLARDGGFIARGYDAELDEARRLRDEGRGVIAAMQADYAATAGVPGLKIRHNNVLGYFIETTGDPCRQDGGADAETFIHRQTTANQVRFTTRRSVRAGERGS